VTRNHSLLPSLALLGSGGWSPPSPRPRWPVQPKRGRHSSRGFCISFGGCGAYDWWSVTASEAVFDEDGIGRGGGGGL
jgi:hypothetical protein